MDIATFELLKEHMLDVYDGSPPPYCILGAGMLSSTVAQFVSYPLALVRTRLQARTSLNLNPNPKPWARACCRPPWRSLSATPWRWSARGCRRAPP